MRNVFLDSGPIITLATNNLLHLFEDYKKNNELEFYITPEVKKEVVDNPIKTKKFRLEAYQVLELIKKDIIKIIKITKEDELLTNRLINDINKIYSANAKDVFIAHRGEIEIVAVALNRGKSTLVVDERTTRQLVENPILIANRMENKLHTKIHIDYKLMEDIHKELSFLKVLRSVDLVSRAVELNYFKNFYDNKKTGKEFLEGMLWACKLKGCAVMDLEIDEYLKEVKL
ncbi:MAG: hypothetical protein PHT94_03245 [Candidatus Nanoarchaeia archaeon]|nr:hypothetical protein [Candidatus Nanoarchaeia archaeon]